MSPPADKATLIRRVSFDLTGLPPSPAEIEAFLADERADAWERLIDRLLASERFGERWAVHWLDVAGYSDSEGYTESDVERRFAWKYRDYVIRAFNDDKPFDQFIREQLAGDEMVVPPYRNLPPNDLEKLVATGFLRMASDGTGSGAEDQAAARNQVVADTVQIVSSALLGLTMNCAQCHHHRYDPISQQDYYRLRAVFEPAYDWKNWLNPNARRVSLQTEEDKTEAARIEEEARVIDENHNRRRAEHIAATYEKQLAKLPEELRGPVREAHDTPESERSGAQKELLKSHPSVNVTAGSLYLYDPKAAEELKKLAAEAAEVRKGKPPEDFIRALWERPGSNPPVTFVFHRGDPDQPADEVGPGGLGVLGDRGAGEIGLNASDRATTGRRLAYAGALTSGRHPLVSRVLVNRFWSHLFGEGIVRTPGDFGVLGEAPDHAELLDWLAGDFTDGGWSLKRFLKQVLMSSVYRQSSRRDPALDAIDPDNRLLGRMPVRRLQAEAIRDAVLCVSGSLDGELLGPPVPVMEDDVGQIVVGMENKDGEGKPGKQVPLEGRENRRSIYIQARRSRPLAVLQAFDRPGMEPNCTARACSTVAPQALMFMNSRFITDYSLRMAERLERDRENDQAGQIRLAWLLAYARPPGEAESRDAGAFLADQRELLGARKSSGAKDDGPNPQTLALATFCQALLSSNGFLYLD